MNFNFIVTILNINIKKKDWRTFSNIFSLKKQRKKINKGIRKTLTVPDNLSSQCEREM